MLKLSVVMATYGRAETIRKTLTCLAEQDLDKDAYELIVIDDASPDNTVEVVEQMMPTLPFETTLLQNDTNSGAGYSQNRGIRAAKAPLMLIMADDILMVPESLSAHLESHAEHPQREVAVLGNVVRCPEIMKESVFLKHFDPFMYEERWGKLDELPFYVWGAANASQKTEFMREHGMFIEQKGRAGAHCHDDVGVGYRLSKGGMRLLFNAKAKGYHHHYYTLDSAAAKWRERGLNWGEFREYMPDPEFTVTSHLLNRRTIGEYLKVLRGPNTLTGKDKYLAWHLFRESVRKAAFNGATIPLFWRPMLNAAEKAPAIANLVRPAFYRAYLHYFWNRAVVEADTIYSEG